jgi:hypothetical protein
MERNIMRHFELALMISFRNGLQHWNSLLNDTRSSRTMSGTRLNAAGFVLIVTGRPNGLMVVVRCVAATIIMEVLGSQAAVKISIGTVLLGIKLWSRSEVSRTWTLATHRSAARAVIISSLGALFARPW